MPETNRGKVWPILSDLPDMFGNISKAVKWIQEIGVGYHYQTMWRDVSTAFQTAKNLDLQRLYDPWQHVPQNLFIEKQWRRPESYNYYGNVYFVDPATGEEFRRSYSIYADTSLTDREVKDIVYHAEEEKEEEYGPDWEVSRFESLGRFHKWGASRSESYGIAEI